MKRNFDSSMKPKRDQRLFHGTVESECKIYRVTLIKNANHYSLLICGSIADFQQTVQRDNGAAQPYSIKKQKRKNKKSKSFNRQVKAKLYKTSYFNMIM